MAEDCWLACSCFKKEEGQYLGSGKGKRSIKSPWGEAVFGIFMCRRTDESDRNVRSDQSRVWNLSKVEEEGGSSSPRRKDP